MTVVGILPAAGHATRLQPLGGSKELLPVRGRAVLDYLVERMVLAGVDGIRIVTRPEKTDLIAEAERRGWDVVTGHPGSVSESLVLGMTGLAVDDIVLFGFPDTIWSPKTGFVPLRRRVETGAALALGIFESPYPGRSDVAVVDDEQRLVRVDVKPAVPVSSFVWACGAAHVGTLRGVGPYAEPGEFFSQLAARVPVATVRLGRVIDIGTPDSLVDAADDPVFEDEPVHPDASSLTNA